MREAVLASLVVSNVEADALEFAAGSNVPTVSESEAGSTGVLRRGEQTKMSLVYLGGLDFSHKGKAQSRPRKPSASLRGFRSRIAS